MSLRFKLNFISAMVLSVAIYSGAQAAGITIPLGCSLNISSNSLTVPGDVINAGTLSLTSGSLTFTGNFTNTGTFSAGLGSTVIIRGATPSEMSGTNIFSNLTIDTNADGAKTIKFGAGQTQTVTETLNLAGYAGKILTIRSTVDGTPGKLKIPNSISSGVNYVDVKDNKITDYNTITAGANSLDSGGNGNWIFGTGPPRNITGSIYKSDRTTKLTTQTVKLSVNGGSIIEKAASAGDFTFSGIPLLSSDKLLVWIADDLVYKGNTVIVSDGQNATGLDIYADNVSVKYLTGSSIVNSDLSAAKGSLVDTDIKYSVAAGNLSVDNGYKFYIPATYTFNPGGTTTFDSLEIAGVFNAAGLDVTVSGDWLNSGTFTSGANTVTFNGTTTISGGSATSFNNVTINPAKQLTGSAANMFVLGNWLNNGSFIHNSGTVTFNGTLAQDVTSGGSNFNNLTVTNAADYVSFKDAVTCANFTAQTASSKIKFKDGANFTATSGFNVNGQASSSRIELISTLDGAPWNLVTPATSANFVSVKNSNSTNTITAYGSFDAGGNTHWVFGTLSITEPQSGKTVGRTPTVIGLATASQTVTIKDISNNTVATTTSDANGNFRVAVSSLALGANSLTPYIGSSGGASVSITVVANPAPEQVPTITYPASGDKVKGNKPTVTGKGKPSAAVTLSAKDANGNLVLTNVAQSTVDSSGNFTISSTDYTTVLPKGTVYLSVTVDGVASSIIEVSFVDPYGVVFDSITDTPIAGAQVTIYTSAGVKCVPGVQIAATDFNPQTTGADGVYSYLTINGDFYLRVSAGGYDSPSQKTTFPADRTIVEGSKGQVFTVSGAVLHIDYPLDSSVLLLKVAKNANKKEVSVGSIVTYTVTIQNPTSSDVSNVYLNDVIPAGFKYIKGKAILDNAAIADPSGERPLVFNIGTVPAGATKTLKYQLVVGSGVTFATYENTAFAKYLDGTIVSNTSVASVKVVPDTLFDLGTTIGKVFHDRNANGIQDPPKKDGDKVIIEEPIPNAQIVTDDGTVITTDNQGRYHLQALNPGRHMFRLDERSLPEGAVLTTPKVVVVDITNGLLAKVNFGVRLRDGSMLNGQTNRTVPNDINIAQDKNIPVPRLNVSLYNDEMIKDAGGKLLPNQFRTFTNYSLFIKKWKLEILDKETKSVAKAFEGDGLIIKEPITWDGKDNSGWQIDLNKNYVYRLIVTGIDGGEDITKERSLIVREWKAEDGIQKAEEEIEKEKQNWLINAEKVNNLDKQNIRITGETIKIKKEGAGIKAIRVLKYGALEREIPFSAQKDLTASDLLENSSAKSSSSEAIDIIVPNGEYDIEIVSDGLGRDGSIANGQKNKTVPEAGETAPLSRDVAMDAVLGASNTVYSKHVKVGEDYLFFVGMGDAKMGYNFDRGNIEPVNQDDKFKPGFWSEKKLSYYLKGKIKGKYLITSSLNTDGDKAELFRNLDPNKYYPVYGDGSSVNYQATNTQGELYLLVEWDKSKILWGNYNTNFTDTEFAQFSRTLYGGRIDYEDVAVTRFGEPRTKLVFFRARALQKAAHNEFIGTGGSLFYLKDQNVVEGSDKIKIEVRDKITGLVLVSKDMERNVEYQIDYSQGRIIFWKPISQITESESIISTYLLSGNLVYVVADYEYKTVDKYDKGNYGARAQQSITDYVRVGGTYVKEEQPDKNYILQGADTVLHLGKDIKVTGEYAESQAQSLGNFISTDGGLSFAEISTSDSSKGKAYGVKAEAYLFNKLGLTGYYKRIEKDFSSASTLSQQGKQLIGGAATFDFTPKTRLKLSHDIQELLGDGNAQTQAQVGAQKTETTVAQLSHQILDKLKLTSEYRKQAVKGAISNIESETNTQGQTIASRLDYKATDKVDLFLEQQLTLEGPANNQTTFGIANQVNKYLQLRAQETIGNKGTATSVGATLNLKDKIELSGDYGIANSPSGALGNTASVTASLKVDDKTKLHTTYSAGETSGVKNQSFTYGSERKINDKLKLNVDKTYAIASDKTSESNTYGLLRETNGRKLEGKFTQSNEEAATSSTLSNIFSLSGDINDKWAGLVSFEKGRVQNLDGTRTNRTVGSFGLSYVDKETIKASSKLEMRFDDGANDTKQFVTYNAIEGKINPDTAVFAKANLSFTKNTTADSTQANYKEISLGAAYRPVKVDWLNLLSQYTYLENNSPDSQDNTRDVEQQRSHVLAAEAVVDLTPQWQLSEKIAYKLSEEKVTGFDFTESQTWLWLNRINYSINEDWKVGAEYRRLAQSQARDAKQGFLIEIVRKIGEFIELGLGYNFTDFNDDLTRLNYVSQGPFLRITGKLYDRTPEELATAKDKWLNARVRSWTLNLVEKELARPGSPAMRQLSFYFSLAQQARKHKRIEESMALYRKILRITNALYINAEAYVRQRIELEERIKEYNKQAAALYKAGRHLEAKMLWQKMIKEAEPQTIYFYVN